MTGAAGAGAPMRLFDTARQEIVPFEPGPIVLMYTCGITPYDASHLGHAATYLTYDILQRRLRDRGHETRCVRNLTDVDDDILRKARELGVHYLDLAAAETARFQADMASLGLLPSWSEPRATSAIADIRGFIGMVLDRGHAYEAGGAVYFDISTFDRFGQISHLSPEEMLPLAAERGATPTTPTSATPWTSSSGSRRPTTSRPGTRCGARAAPVGTSSAPPSPCGSWGRPSTSTAGARISSTRTTNARPPSPKAATGEPFVRHWMHQAMVRMDGEKMSKSLGNLVFVSDLLKTWDARVIRLGVLAHHYRDSWSWNEGIMPAAAERLAAWQAAGDGDAALEEVRQALDTDLDTPAALAAVDQAADDGRGVSDAAALLGVDLTE